MTLTEAANFTNKGVRYILIPVSIIMIVWIMISILRAKPELPGNYITPDYMCGQLPEIEMTSLDIGSTTEFSIETEAGAVPDLPEVVNVFKYAHPGQSLLALEEAKQTAQLLGFEKDKYSRISVTEYRWRNEEMKQTLIIEMGNQNLSLTTDFTDPDVDTWSETLPSEERARTIATQYLQKMNLLYRDYAQGTMKTIPVQVTATGEFREAPSLSEADLIRVDFFRTIDLITIGVELTEAEELGPTLREELESEDVSTITTEDSDTEEVKQYMTDIFADTPKFGNITVYVGGREENESANYSIFGIEYKNWFLPERSCGTYRLISAQEAVRRVQEGSGILVYLLEKDADRIIPYETKSVENMTILEVSLKYLDRSERQEFLQPIYVIRGEAYFGESEYNQKIYGEFYYYVPAVDYESIPPDAGIAQPDGDESEE